LQQNVRHEYYDELPLGSIKPKGWLLHQLRVMAKGSTGHLDERYDRLKTNNAWLGGDGDGGEETPYWLDGVVPLAYCLDDKILLQKVLKYIKWTIEHQRASGYFGPYTKDEIQKKIVIRPDNCRSGDDWWPKIIMLKVLKEYYSATNDQRVISFMTRFFDYQLEALKLCPLNTFSGWAEARASDNAMMVLWLYRFTKNDRLFELFDLLNKQSLHWSDLFYNRDWVIDAAANQTGRNVMQRHSVNVAMALKDPSINYLKTHGPYFLKAQKTGFNDLMKLHGLPMGVFSGDEDLHGNEPTQGTELCTVVETMFSLEKIIGITGDIRYMDAVERIAYNALPAQTTDDYNYKQYFQMPNQVQVSKGPFDYSVTSENGYSCVFGTGSGYTCCYANMHQGWPKFTEHLWYKTPANGIAALMYAPSEIKTTIDKQEILITENTEYPFDEKIHFTMQTKSDLYFPFQLRIPSWCEEAWVYINGERWNAYKGGQVITVSRSWKNMDKLTLHLPMKIFTSNWAKNSMTVERGPLVYALQLEEQWQQHYDSTPGPGFFYTIATKEPWNFALLQNMIQDLPAYMQVISKPLANDFVWNQQNAPIALTTLAKQLPDWIVINNVARQPVTDRSGLYRGKVNQDVKKITLIPYGCTKLRVTAFPVVE